MTPSSQRISIALPAACCVAVIAFAVSLAVGAMVDNPASAVLARSLIAMVVTWPIGFVVGIVLEQIFQKQVANEVSEAAQADFATGDFEEDVEIIDESEAESKGSVVDEASASAAA
ncbi:MAG: hypothetical protein CMJ34_10340 [Phycisphaerae bacterium]|jgi:hypothetical protein|nr:hypothetical protein [Phycisphaerae bacterium]